jgi:hypothetical protein
MMAGKPMEYTFRFSGNAALKAGTIRIDDEDEI